MYYTGRGSARVRVHIPYGVYFYFTVIYNIIIIVILNTHSHSHSAEPQRYHKFEVKKNLIFLLSVITHIYLYTKGSNIEKELE